MHRGTPKRRRQSAFTLLELMVTVVIVGVIAAIAVPRMSSAAESASYAATRRDHAQLQRQIELYAAEHLGAFPAYYSDGANAAHSSAAFVSQLTLSSRIDGQTSSTPSAAYAFGPYLRTGIPTLKVGPKAGLNGVRVVTGSTRPDPSASYHAGWVYNDTTGQIVPNIPDAVSFEDAILRLDGRPGAGPLDVGALGPG